MQLPVVRLKWVDAVCSIGWCDNIKDHASTLAEEAQVQTVGFLISEDENFLKVSSTLSGDEHLGSVLIPKGWIVSREELEFN